MMWGMLHWLQREKCSVFLLFLPSLSLSLSALQGMTGRGPFDCFGACAGAGEKAD